jgi:acetyltransferase-like isoleucine patch superfamily enzyme
MQITVPRFNSNDDKVILTKWLVKTGDYVKKGQPIACFETSKADIEYESETEGKIFPGVPEKTEVNVGYIIGVIDDFDFKMQNTEMPQFVGKLCCNNTPKLTENIHEIKKYNEPWVAEIVTKDDLVNTTFKFTQNVRKIGKNTITYGKITAKHLEIGDNTIIKECNIEADTVIIGKNCVIGDGNNFLANKIVVGDNFRTAQNVKIDVSGGITKKSVFQAGNDCLLCMDVYVNCCREVILGDRVCLSPRSMVFTHRYWQDVRLGYDAAFNKVVFENDSWLGANAVVMPGVTVGAGSVIMASSAVVDNVHRRTMVGGVPAVKLKQIPDKNNFDEDKFSEFVKLREEYLGTKIMPESYEYRECLRRFGIREDI